MVPNFALSLSFDGIALLRRRGDVWARIQDVSFEADDLDAAMSALRDRALALDPKGTEVVLLIPNEQIRYMDLPDLGGDEVTREIAIRAGLDGATPYEVKDLSFDYTLSQGQIQVAAVANETLDEAQGFAKTHGFTPISFAAQAPEGAFKGAVFFGKAKGWRRAARRLPQAVQIVPADAAALAPVAEPAPAPVLEATSQMALALDAGGAQDLDPIAPGPAATAAEADVPQLDAAQVSVGEAPDAVEPAVPDADADAEADTAPLAETAEPDTAGPDEETRARRKARRAERRARQKADPDEQAEPSTEEDDAPAEPAAAEDPPSRPDPAAAPDLPKPGKAPPLAGVTAEDRDAPAAVPVSFSTIRASRGAEASGIPPAPRALKLGEDEGGGVAKVAPRFHPVLQDRPRPTADDPEVAGTSSGGEAVLPDDGPVEEPKTKAKGLLGGGSLRLKRGSKKARDREPVDALQPAPDPAPAATVGAVPDPSAPATPAVTAPPTEAPAVKAPSPLSRLAALRTAEGTAAPGTAPAARHPDKAETTGGGTLARLSRARKAQEQKTVTAGGAVALNERERMTVFGMRKEQKIGGKPRFLGLMLTAALLLFLIGVAAWASVFLDDGLASLFRREEPAAVAALPDPVPQADPAPLPDSAVAAPAEDAAEAAEDVELAALDSAAPADDLPPARAEPSAPRVLTPEEATATYAATGIWQRTPSAPLQPPTDGVEDIYVASIDPSVQQFDAVALPQARQLARDAALEDPGLPPPAGMVFDFDARGLIRATPEGALSPEGLRIYTGRPPVVPPLRNAALAPQADVRSDVDPAGEANPLSSFRPEARPDDIIEQRERATLGGISRDELAALRPVQRPKTAQEAAVEAAPEEPATAQAVSASLVPLARPRNMEAIVRRAEEARPAEPVQQAAAAAAVARPLAPSGPTATSVARAATDPNAINLSRINLIGVYGTPSNRRALVRLPGSGKYEKVKIGDRLDGGRVQSISDEALVYVKGGRSITLKMPRG